MNRILGVLFIAGIVLLTAWGYRKATGKSIAELGA